VSIDDLMERARPLVTDGRLPSRSTLRNTLGVRWDKVTAVHQTLADELRIAALKRDDRRRAMLARRAARKTTGRRLVRRAGALPEVPVSPIVGPLPPAVRPAAEGITAPPPDPFPQPRKAAATWPLVLLAFPAFVAIWSGWVDLGRLTGFGVVHPFPGIWDEARLNTAITLPVGLETYAAYALYVWLSAVVPAPARRFAKWSAIGSLALGAAGQVAYHLMVAAGMERAPWQITTAVACLPVAVLGLGAALRHLVHAGEDGVR
jgi:hypothetical protein